MLKRLGLLVSTVALLSGTAILTVSTPAGAVSATTGSPQQDYVYGLFADYLAPLTCPDVSTWSNFAEGYGPFYVDGCAPRTPDSTALSYYSAQLGLATMSIPPSASAMSSVAGQIMGSAEYRNDLVTWAYNCYLGRSGDAAGVAYFDALKGVNFNSLAVSMLASNELFGDTVSSANETSSTYGPQSGYCGATQTQYGAGAPPATTPPNGNFDTWLANVYSVLLSRSVDPAGKAYYDAQYVKGVSLAAIVTSILNSSEYETDQVSNFYTHFLRRDFVTTPDSSGVAYWVAQMKNGAGLTPEQVTAGITSTPEYWAFTQSSNNQ